MIISELNYLESAEAEVFGGDGFTTEVTSSLSKTVTQNVNETTFKSFEIDTAGLGGNLAEVSGSSDAFGGNKNVAQIVFVTQTTGDGAGALVNSTAYSLLH